MKKLLIATYNPGKIREYKEFFKRSKIPLKLVFLKDLNIKIEVEENGKTFEEIALKKAKFYSGLSGLPALADDSGLEIDYLNGEPGIKSRRWPGYDASDQEIIDLTLKKLTGLSKNKRRAQMKVVIAFIIPPKRIYTFDGIIRGVILEKSLKKRFPGFPFRSLFYIPSKKSMLGEKESHRQRAFKKALPTIKKYLC